MSGKNTIPRLSMMVCSTNYQDKDRNQILRGNKRGYPFYILTNLNDDFVSLSDHNHSSDEKKLSHILLADKVKREVYRL